MATDRPSQRPPSDEEQVRTSREPAAETKSLDAQARSPFNGIAIEGYELIRELHRGGQGIVYEAFQKSTKRKVALKVLLAGRHAHTSAKKRFQREIELVAQLKHPHIISIFDSGITSDGLPYYVMDYVRGTRLNRYVHDKELTLEATLGLFSMICHGVHYANRRGVVHRDLKPSNILIDVDGNPRILDFGLAKLLAGPADAAVSITQDVLGTLPYMSPEQARGSPDEVDARIDVYALGVVLYQLLTGHFPYPVAGQVTDVLRHVVETQPTPPARRWSPDSGITRRSTGGLQADTCPIDGEVETILLTALAKERERRYQSAGELASDIDRYLAGDPIEARRDSIAYVLRTRCRAVAQRHRITTFLGVIAISTVLAWSVGIPLISRWTPANTYYERFVIDNISLPGSGPALDKVRIVTLTDDTDVAGIVRRESLEDVTSQNTKSLRRLHGRLMEKLAASGCRVVMWPIMFSTQSDFDDGFVRGVRALKRAGAEVVVSVRSWRLDAKGLPKLSRAIAASDVKWGVAVLKLNPPMVQMVAKRGLLGSQPSLTLATFAAYRHPGKQFLILLDVQTQAAEVLFRAATTAQWQADRAVAVERIPLTVPEADGDADDFDGAFAEQFGLKRQDYLGIYRFEVASDSILATSIVEYEQVFSADERQLREWFEGKAVVVGDIRQAAGGRYPITDGREVPVSYVQASAIDSLLRSVFVRMPSVTGEWFLPFVGAVMGCLAGFFVAHRHKRRYLALMVLTALLFAVSMAGYWRVQYLFNPVVPVLAMVLAAELAAAAQRIALSRQV